MPKTVAAMCGSLRKGSYNRMLMREAIARAPAGLTIAEAEIRGIPLYDDDVLVAGMPPEVARVKEAVRAADGLLLVSPEYDFGVPGVLKNAIDWMTRPADDNVLRGKPMAVTGASTGYMGTMRGQLAWRQCWHYNKAPVFSAAELTVSFAAKAFDGEGHLADEVLSTQLDVYLAALLAWLEGLRWPAG